MTDSRLNAPKNGLSLLNASEVYEYTMQYTVNILKTVYSLSNAHDPQYQSAHLGKNIQDIISWRVEAI